MFLTHYEPVNGIPDRWPGGDFAKPAFLPPVDVVAHDDSWVCLIDLPGVAFDDINVEVKGDALVISAKREKIAAKDDGKYTHSERSFGNFNRVLTLPDDADKDDISATSHDGVLEIRIGRGKDALARRIEVKAGRLS